MRKWQSRILCSSIWLTIVVCLVFVNLELFISSGYGNIGPTINVKGTKSKSSKQNITVIARSKQDLNSKQTLKVSGEPIRKVSFSNFTRSLLEHEPLKLSPSERVCKPRTNIAFLKVHKTGSSTIMTMFYRFADKHNLNIVLPNSTKGNFNYLGYGRTMNPSSLIKLPTGEEYNILCNHVMYNKTIFKAVMPRDTLTIGILRDPVANFISAFSYFGVLQDLQSKMIKKIGSPLPDSVLMKLFLQRPDAFGSSTYNHYIHNKMSFDFGLHSKNFDDDRAIDEFIVDIDNDFILVIILEHLDESLVLMRRILCWEFKDILYVPANVRISPSYRERLQLNKESIKKLEKYNKADFKLYSFFKNRLLTQIRDLGPEFKSEVKYLKIVQSQLVNYCSRYPRQNLTVHGSKWNTEFTVTSTDCDFMMTDELMLVRDRIIKGIDKYEIWKRRTRNIRRK